MLLNGPHYVHIVNKCVENTDIHPDFEVHFYIYFWHCYFETEFIRPVCLPLEGDSNAMNDKAWLKLTGWGFLDAHESNAK